MNQPQPKSADLVTPFLFRIVWRDGAITEHHARDLRLACPCAQCVDELTGKPLLEPKAVKDDILLLAAELVGRYGLCFTWSDMHRTGIFTWPLLRKLGGIEAAQ